MSSPSVQIFHEHLSRQTITSSGSYTIASVNFSNSAAGAFIVSSQQPIEGTQSGLQQFVEVVLDGSVVDTLVLGQDFSMTIIGITTSHDVASGNHTLSLVYVLDIAIPGNNILLDNGSMSLAVVLSATSN